MKCDYMSKGVKRMIKVKQDSALTGRGQVHSITQTPSVIIRYVVLPSDSARLPVRPCQKCDVDQIVVVALHLRQVISNFSVDGNSCTRSNSLMLFVCPSRRKRGKRWDSA